MAVFDVVEVFLMPPTVDGRPVVEGLEDGNRAELELCISILTLSEGVSSGKKDERLIVGSGGYCLGFVWLGVQIGGVQQYFLNL